MNKTSKILVVKRIDWLQILEEDHVTSISEFYAAIIIVDDNDECTAANKNCFRPSYPISDLVLVINFIYN